MTDEEGTRDGASSQARYIIMNVMNSTDVFLGHLFSHCTLRWIDPSNGRREIMVVRGLRRIDHPSNVIVTAVGLTGSGFTVHYK